MRAKWEISSREEFPINWLKLLRFSAFWIGLSVGVLLLLPERAWDIKFHGLVAIAFVGIWRYSWFMLNLINAFIYMKWKFPKLLKKTLALKNPYPKRVYFMIPSYKEKFSVSEQVFTALVNEVYRIPSEVYVFVSVGSEEEAEFIQSVINRYDMLEQVKVFFLKQEMGKRVAMGHTLRAIARHFYDPLYWHEDYKEDIVVFMDGDTVMGKEILKRTLPFFKIDPKLAALTTDEGINYIGRTKLMYLWYKLKFAKRHLMMMAHSMHDKVLTLTGRFSVFRAHIVLEEEFIRYIEADHLDHYLYGRFRFLMGDDKSTWFYLLKEGYRMLYIPNTIAWSTEDRSGNFFKISASLMFRWYGNMLRNNWRAIKLGPKRIGSWYIWWAIIDQRISMWTSLVSITGVTLLSLFISPFYFVFYFVWPVIWIRTLQLVILGLFSRLNPEIIHLPMQLYDQWVGSLIKIYASSNLAKQRWAKGAKQAVEAKVYSYRFLRTAFRQFLFVFYITVFIIFVGLYVGVFKLPRFGPIPEIIGIANAKEFNPETLISYGVVPDDGADDSEGLQRLISEHRGEAEIKILLPSGKLVFEKSLVIDRDNVQIVGKENTLIESKIKGKGEAVIYVRGSKGQRVGYLLEPATKGSREVSLSGYIPSNTQFIWIGAPNDADFLKSIGSKVWKKDKPFVRQGIYKVLNVDGSKVVLSDELEIDYPAGAEVYIIEPVSNFFLENVRITQIVPGAQAEQVRFLYENTYPEYAVDTLHLKWVVDSLIRGLRVEMSGRHPLYLEESYGITVENLEVFGSWNKGKGGNGYVTFSKTHKSTIQGCRIEGIRHFVFQWASSRNLVTNCTFRVDINFHGGFTRFNTVRDSVIDLPPEHRWSPIERTPQDAHWAPPDGEGNEVVNTRIVVKRDMPESKSGYSSSSGGCYYSSVNLLLVLTPFLLVGVRNLIDR